MLQVGFVGVGGRAQVHLKALDAIGQTRVVAVVDALPDAAERVATERGATTYPSVGEMLAAERLDAVYTVVPYHVSAEVAIPVLQAKVPLFIEKVLALRPSDARAIAAAAEMAGVPTAVGYQFRYLDTVDRLREAMSPERAGMVAGHFYAGKPHTRWGLERQYYGGQVYAQLTHVLDLSRYVVGDVQSVDAAYGQRMWPPAEREPGFDVWDVYAVLCRYTEGAVGAFHCAYGLSGSMELRVLARDEQWTLSGRSLHCQGPDGQSDSWEAAIDPVVRMHEAFLRAVTSGHSDLVRSDVGDALQSMLVCAAANQSAAQAVGIALDDV